jgi:DNA-binding CsgD family transcriptional regulator/PAS domain-containing protein
VNVAVAIRADPDAKLRYNEYYGALDSWFRCGRHLLITGHVVPGQKLCPDSILERSEFYNDFLRPLDSFHEFCGVISNEPDQMSLLTCMRPREADPFGAEETTLLQVLLPHLQRAFVLQRQIGALRSKAESAENILDRLPVGVVVVGAKGDVLTINRRARSMIEQNDGISLSRACLRATRPGESKQLQTLVQGATAAGNGNGFDAGGAMTISRPSLRRPYGVLVSPLRAGLSWTGPQQPAAVIFISDPESALENPDRELARLFGLTPAEARLACMLMQGKSLNGVAEELGVARNTVHSQLQKIFEKTGTNRQAELMRLLLKSPAQFRLCDGPRRQES